VLCISPEGSHHSAASRASAGASDSDDEVFDLLGYEPAHASLGDHKEEAETEAAAEADHVAEAEHAAEADSCDGADEAPTAERSLELEALLRLPADELKRRCKDEGLPVTGSKVLHNNREVEI